MSVLHHAEPQPSWQFGLTKLSCSVAHINPPSRTLKVSLLHARKNTHFTLPPAPPPALAPRSPHDRSTQSQRSTSSAESLSHSLAPLAPNPRKHLREKSHRPSFSPSLPLAPPLSPLRPLPMSPLSEPRTMPRGPPRFTSFVALSPSRKLHQCAFFARDRGCTPQVPRAAPTASNSGRG